MDVHEYQLLQSELPVLDRLLAQTPEKNVINRMSLQARKDAVMKALTSYTPPLREPARARLTFQGKPVVGNYGIFAKFGGEAIDKFADAVRAFAASRSGPLGTRGAIPNRDDYQLIITGTAPGSFGFDLEEHLIQSTLPMEGPSLVGQAIKQTCALMTATQGSDDDLADVAAESDPRAIVALRDFLKTMADHEAVCALQFQDKVIRFTNTGQVRRSAERLSQDNIHEDEQYLDGAFIGVLPKKRTFEFRLAATGEIITGRVGPDIIDAGVINQVLEQQTTIQVQTTRVGDGRPRYVLLHYGEPLKSGVIVKDGEKGND
ncbi:MAG: hypothetical protein HQK60_07885 [Deltaproteobacteria bacterium]|nr:hypothetical protein [Deltaproteobacteria bacterium]